VPQGCSKPVSGEQPLWLGPALVKRYSAAVSHSSELLEHLSSPHRALVLNTVAREIHIKYGGGRSTGAVAPCRTVGQSARFYSLMAGTPPGRTEPAAEAATEGSEPTSS
jgi:hypothetical protein